MTSFLLKGDGGIKKVCEPPPHFNAKYVTTSPEFFKLLFMIGLRFLIGDVKLKTFPP